MNKISAILLALTASVATQSAFASDMPSFDYMEGNYLRTTGSDSSDGVQFKYSKRFGDLYFIGDANYLDLGGSDASRWHFEGGVGYILPLTNNTSFDVSGHVGHARLNISGPDYTMTTFRAEGQLRTKLTRELELFGALGFEDSDRSEDDSDSYVKLGANYQFQPNWSATVSFTNQDGDDLMGLGIRYSF